MSANPPPPLFVAGFFRSGTSLVRRILDSHPRIHCPTEIKLFKDFFGHYINDPLAHVRFFQSLHSAGARQELVLEIMGSAYLQLRRRMAEELGKPRWADKDPEHLLYLDSIEKIAPGFQLILCIRDPRDILSSLAEARFNKTIQPNFGDRLALLVQHWQSALRFLESNPDRTHVIEYEYLVSQPTESLKGLFAFIDEPYSPDILEKCFGPQVSRGLEDPKLRQTTSIHPNSVARWKNDLTEQEAEEVMTYAEDLWRRFTASRQAGTEMRL
jgi:hypothetical protein